MNLMDQIPTIVVFLIQIFTLVRKKLKKKRNRRTCLYQYNGDVQYVDDYGRLEEDVLKLDTPLYHNNFENKQL